jgi:sterol desaturase/sphingolipid hydroxylase (fatty acid hydroxylase superfamily)
MENMFGMINGKYFGEPPLYVNKNLPAGMTDIPAVTVLSWIQKAPFLLITSPNCIWAIISLALYTLAPYNLDIHSPAAISPINYAFFSERFPLWFGITFGYTSFWHIALYGLNMAKRPFIKDRVYSINKVIHNAFWTTSGIAIWTVFENIFVYLWATGRLAYIPDAISISTPSGVIAFIATLMGIPVWRSIHFYFAHRFLHYTPLYKQVHSLHHRNTDTEPFSGLCMHPVEHLYYFACIAPSLLFYCSPFALVWNGIHLLLSPAASHSGYEDHFQSDIFHYLHHRYFECNYAGSDAAFMDIAFGTFKSSFNEDHLDTCGPKAREDAKSTLFLVPTQEFVTYLAGSSLCIIPWAYYSLQNYQLSTYSALIISSLVGVGPSILSVIVSNAYKRTNATHPIKMSVVGNILHIAVGLLLCAVPLTYGCYLVLS